MHRPYKIYFFSGLISIFLTACETKTDIKSTPIQFLEVPQLTVRNDDPLIQFRDSIQLYGNAPFSGHLTNGLKQANKLDYGYVNGLQEGTQRGWHFDGKLSFEYTCHLGQRTGDYKEYYPSGMLQIQAFYKDGKEIKKKILDLDGKVIANYILKDGRYYGLMGSSNCMTLLNDNE